MNPQVLNIRTIQNLGEHPANFSRKRSGMDRKTKLCVYAIAALVVAAVGGCPLILAAIGVLAFLTWKEGQ